VATPGSSRRRIFWSKRRTELRGRTYLLPLLGFLAGAIAGALLAHSQASKSTGALTTFFIVTAPLTAALLTPLALYERKRGNRLAFRFVNGWTVLACALGIIAAVLGLLTFPAHDYRYFFTVDLAGFVCVISAVVLVSIFARRGEEAAGNDDKLNELAAAQAQAAEETAPSEPPASHTQPSARRARP
jgi:drug/metabolite transporter (DMT)-like permease